MVDLFCGRGGWTKGFQAHGWHCVGIDLFSQPDYPGEFIQADIAQLLELPPADFYCCSSPCENFSLFRMRMFHKNPPWPWLGISLFNGAKALLDATGKPYIMENVSGATDFVGPAVNHLGPFYLWGPGVPAIFPPECYKIKKGIDLGSSAVVNALKMSQSTQSHLSKADREQIKEYRRKFDSMWSSSKSPERKEATAKAAEIPVQLSSHIAQIAGTAC